MTPSGGVTRDTFLTSPGKANRRPLALQPSQAYSALYYKEGSPLWQEIKDLYTLYKSGDATTISRLGPLFDPAEPDPPQIVSPVGGETVPPPNVKSISPNVKSVPPPDADAVSLADAAAIVPSAGSPAQDATTRRRRKKGQAATSNAVKKLVKNVPFIHFQQTIIREKLKTMSDEEAVAVENHIESLYTTAVKAWERPWLASSSSGKPENELEADYYQK